MYALLLMYTHDQHKRLIHKLQAKEKNYDLLPMKCLERIRSAPIKSKRGKQLWRFLSAKDEESYAQILPRRQEKGKN